MFMRRGALGTAKPAELLSGNVSTYAGLWSADLT
jgi:hypothetical protein